MTMKVVAPTAEMDSPQTSTHFLENLSQILATEGVFWALCFSPALLLFESILAG